MNEARVRRNRRNERGSALLIVFVFAAIVAISLYMEMPVAAFEAQRQKEQILIDRGHEYAHAVKLFVRKTGHYPTSLKDLEDTNRMRFLRRQFNDPFTGKQDWRLLHAGPNGMLIDSKVPQTQNPLLAQNGNRQNGNGTNPGVTPTGTASFGASNPNGTAASSNSNSGAPTTSGFDSSFANSGSSGDATIVRPVPTRKPEVAAGGSGPAEAGSAPDSLLTDPGASLVPPIDNSGPVNGANGVSGTPGANAASGAASPAGGANAAGATTPAGTPGAANDLRTSLLSGATPGATGTVGASGTAGTTGATTGGTLNSGGVAGVASKAKGRSIKTVNDQEDYSLWEFYYDPQKELTSGIANALQNSSTNANGANNNANGTQPNSSTNTFGPASTPAASPAAPGPGQAPAPATPPTPQ